MDQAAFLTELNIRIGDTDNFTFTSDEKTSVINEALNDEYVVTDNWDTSLTFTTGTYQYPLPTDVDTIQDIYIKADNSQDYPSKIEGSLWEIINGNIHFMPGADVIPNGYMLYLKSKTKYDSASTVAEVGVQEYVLSLAQLRLYRTMLAKKSMRFLKNDTSVAEIVAIKRDLEQDVARYRRRQPTSYQVA